MQEAASNLGDEVELKCLNKSLESNYWLKKRKKKEITALIPMRDQIKHESLPVTLTLQPQQQHTIHS